jgi:hypothetical protein
MELLDYKEKIKKSLEKVYCWTNKNNKRISFDRRGEVYPMIEEVKKLVIRLGFPAAGVTVFS